MMRSAKRNGFTLVEVVVSVALLALTLAGSYTLINRATAVIQSARNRYIAINIGKNRIERARVLQYGALSMMSETNMQVDANGVPSSAGDFRRTTLVDTNVTPGVTLMTVNTEVRSVRTQKFGGDTESLSCLFTEYLTLGAAQP